MFARALVAIGDISALAALASVAPGVRRQIISWLAPLVQIVRKLLLAEAAALHRRPNAGAGAANSPPPRGGRGRGGGESGGGESAAAKVYNFNSRGRATFALSPPRDPLLVPDARAPRIRALWDEGPPIFASAPTPANTKRAPTRPLRDAPLRLARRLEALQRVLENPLPHARRLARMLTRARRRFPEIAHRYLFAPARTGDYDKEDPRLAIDAISAALSAPDVITNSS